jgi:RecA-family ATPase
MKAKGIPLESIYDAPRELDWYYEGRLQREDRLLLITGDGGVGKTIFVANLMLSMAAGRPFMGREFLGRPPRFLYIDLDMGEQGLKTHLMNVSLSMGMSRADIAAIEDRVALYCEGTSPLPHGFDIGYERVGGGVLRSILAETNPDIIVVESWSDLCGTTVDMDSNNAVNAAMRDLRSYGEDSYAWWIIHHEGKSKYDAIKSKKLVQHRGIGAQAMGKAVHRNFSLRRVQDDGVPAGGMMRNRVEWGKVRLGAQPRDFDYEFGKGPDGRFKMEYLREVD